MKNVEITSDHMTSESPSAFLYCNGNAIYFDEKGDQIPELQMIGLKALSEFVRRFPESKIYWGIWREKSQLMSKECVEDLLKHLRHPYE